jgi:hypothetical protein
MSLFDNGGCVKLVSKDYEVNLYKAGYVSTLGWFVEVGEGARVVSKEDAKFIHDGFNLAKIPLSHMMKSIALGAKSSYLGKIHYVELDTPCFDFGEPISVEQGFITFLKGILSLGGEGTECLAHYSDGGYLYLTLRKGEEVIAQVRADTTHEVKFLDILDVGKAMSQKKSFTLRIHKDDVSMGEVFDVFSISLTGQTEKQLQLEIVGDHMVFTSFDLGNQPTKVTVPVRLESGSLDKPLTVTYQSLVDIFSRDGVDEYKVEGFESVVVLETDKTKDLLVTFI